MTTAATRRNATRRLGAALIVLGAIWLSGCSDREPSPPPVSPPSASASDRQTAFRIREDAAAELNGSDAWAADIDQAAVVTVDQPFRLRFEIEAGSDPAPRRYRLEMRRNDGDWQPVAAEDFPYPQKLVELAPASGLGQWNIEQGSAAAIATASEDGMDFWRIETDAEPLLAWARADIHWTPSEIGLRFRLPDEADAGMSIVFDQADNGAWTALELLPPDSIRIVGNHDTRSTVLAEQRAVLTPGEWQELKILVQQGEVVIELDDTEVLNYAPSAGTVLAPRPGIFMANQRVVELESFALEAESATPRSSIIRAPGFTHGTPTRDVLPVAATPFTGGAGISFAEQTPSWIPDGGHAEWSFPLVIRRFADEALLNEDGDRFDYRLVDVRGRPVPADVTASVRLRVPDGHLGGTFVETPMRIGPWQAGNGDLYFIMEPSETWNRMMVVKSSDDGRTWREVDGENRPATGDLEGFASVLIGDRIHMLHQTSDEVLYHAFDTADHPQRPDAWAIRDERVEAPREPPTQVADLAVRADGRIIAVYGAGEELRVAVRGPDGGWSDPRIIDQPRGSILSGPSLVLDANGIAHLAYTASDGSAWYRRIDQEDTLGEPFRFAADLATGEEDVGAILPLVSLVEQDSVAVLWRAADGRLRERRVDAESNWTDPVVVSDRIVVQSTVDSDQVGADTVVDGDTVHVLFIEQDSGRLFHTTGRDGIWTEPTPAITNTGVQWVRGNIVRTADGGRAYGFVYDAGSNGGSGRNTYARIPLR